MHQPYTFTLDPNVWNNAIAEIELVLIGKHKNKIAIDSNVIGVKGAKLPQDIPVFPGIYAIWSNNSLKYIGETTNLKGRLKEHFISTSRASKLNEIKKEVLKNRKMYVSFVCVSPASFRLAVEDRLIGKVKEDKPASLPWNDKSKNVADCTNWLLDTLKEAGNGGLNSIYLIHKYVLECDFSVKVEKLLKRLVKEKKIEYTNEPGCEGYRLLKRKVKKKNRRIITKKN